MTFLIQRYNESILSHDKKLLSVCQSKCNVYTEAAQWPPPTVQSVAQSDLGSISFKSDAVPFFPLHCV